MKSKIYVVISAIVLVIAIVGSTFALVYYRSDVTGVNITFDTNIGAFINYKSGNPILGGDAAMLELGNSYSSGLSTEIELWKTTEARNMDIFGHIYLDIDVGSDNLLNVEALKWAVTSNDILISEGNFVGYSVGTSVPVLVNQKLLITQTKFKVYIWLDESEIGNSNLDGETFEVTVRCEATSGEYKSFETNYEYNFNYTGDVQSLTITKSGNYRLEVWGAQGGYGMNETYRGGYGGYSVGEVNLAAGQTLYVVVGGQGGNGLQKVNTLNEGGYNGGGNTYGHTDKYSGSGGGATHIALSDGLLSSFSETVSDILIVAGGGGGGCYQKDSENSVGGNGGGYIGNDTITNATYTYGTGGTQIAGGTGQQTGSFGQGANAVTNNPGSIGGGGGFYGGGSGKWAAGGGGGSGYIGNSLLTNKVMYCYECQDSSEEADETNIKTRSTINVDEEAIPNYAKIGNGYAKITDTSQQDTPPITRMLSRKSITYGSYYDFKVNVVSELGEGYTITYSTYDNANTLAIGEYQIKYIAEDNLGNEYTYYQKVEIIGG